MKEVLEFIQEQKQEFAKLRLFQFMQDDTIDPFERVAWAPCFAPFAMNFKDINYLALRDEPTDNPIQEMINRHTYEDGRHWSWYLNDIQALGINFPMTFTEALKFLWGKETVRTRALCYDLFALSKLQKDPMIKLAMVESIEVTGTVALAALSKLGRDLEKVTNKKLRYLSAYHLGVETGHVQSGLSYDDTDDFLRKIELTEEQRAEAIECAATVFRAFSESVEEMMDYAEKHTIENPYPETIMEQLRTPVAV